MRTCGRLFIVLTALLLAVGNAHAGIYNPGAYEETATPERFNLPGGGGFHDILLRLRSINDAHPNYDNPVRQRYRLMTQLALGSSLASLRTPEEQLQISANLIRTRKFKGEKDKTVLDAVILMLRPLTLAQRENFLLRSNLATAYQMNGQLTEARLEMGQALKDWPKTWADYDPDKTGHMKMKGLITRLNWQESIIDFDRECDARYLKLLTLRSREKLAGIDPEKADAVDAIFDDPPPALACAAGGAAVAAGPVRFVGKSGAFEPGRIASLEKSKLPANALAIVQRLLVWLPDDLRLYWLLGELYNIQGAEEKVQGGKREYGPKRAEGVRSASMIFDELMKFKYSAAEVARRRDALQQAVTIIAQEDEEELQKDLDNVPTRNPDAERSVDWRTFGIGVGTGFVVALFAIWQMREVRRRWQARQASANRVGQP